MNSLEPFDRALFTVAVAEGRLTKPILVGAAAEFARAETRETFGDYLVRIGRLAAMEALDLEALVRRHAGVCTGCRKVFRTKEPWSRAAERPCPSCGEPIVAADSLRPASPDSAPTRPAAETLYETTSDEAQFDSGALATVLEGPDRIGAAPAGRDSADRIGPYAILAKLGEGGMGVVYRALDPVLGREVGLKVLKPGFSEEALERFEIEGRAMAGIEHPNVLRVYDAGRADGAAYLVMELLPGPALDAFVGEGRPRLGVADAVRRTAQAARGLAAAHALGILHRDIKPANLILGGDGKVRVADFGLARLAASGPGGLTGSDAFMGTPSYMSPEQADDSSRVTAASDVYSLGATLYSLLSGALPFEARTIFQLLVLVMERDPAPLSRLVPGLPRDVEAIVGRAMEKEAARRYPSAAELADDLERFLDGRIVVARRPGPVERARRWAWRHRRTAGPIAALVLALAGLAGWRVGSDALARRRLDAADRRATELVLERTGIALAAIEAGRPSGVDREELRGEVESIYEAAGLASDERTRSVEERLAAFPARRVRSADLVLLGTELAAGGEDDRALVAFRAVDDPELAPAARAAEIDVLLRAERLDEALARAAEVAATDACPDRLLFRKAWLERRLGRFDEYAATVDRLLRRTHLSSADRRTARLMERWSREWLGPRRAIQAPVEFDHDGGSFEVRVEGTEASVAMASLDPRPGEFGGCALEIRIAGRAVVVEVVTTEGRLADRIELATAGPVRVLARLLVGPGTLDVVVESADGQVLGRAYRPWIGTVFAGRYRFEAQAASASLTLFDSLEPGGR